VNEAVVNFASDVGNYNLISLGNTTFNAGTDTYGGLAVYGNLTIDGATTIAQQPSLSGSNGNQEGFVLSTDPTLYVNGQLTLSAGVSLNSGYASLPNVTDSWSSSTPTQFAVPGGQILNSTNASGSQVANSNYSSDYKHDPTLNPTPGTIDGTTSSNWWATLKAGDSVSDPTSFATISDSLAAAATTGTAKVDSGGNLVLTPSNTTGVQIFDIDASVLDAAKNIAIDVPQGDTYVINVQNAAGATLSGFNDNSGNNTDQLLWNLEGTGATTLGSGGGAFYGSVLAPGINLTADTAIQGQVVSDDFTLGSVQLDEIAFVPTVSLPCPEPSTYALAGAAVCGLGILLRRRAGRSVPAHV